MEAWHSDTSPEGRQLEDPKELETGGPAPLHVQDPGDNLEQSAEELLGRKWSDEPCSTCLSETSLV